MSSNFAFLEKNWRILSEIGYLAEKNLYTDTNTSFIKLRMFCETTAKYLFAYEKLETPKEYTQLAAINVLAAQNIIPDRFVPLFHSIRKTGNDAVHSGYSAITDAQTHLKFAFYIAVWFYQTYADDPLKPPEFILPKQMDYDVHQLAEINQALQERSANLENEIKQLQSTLDEFKARALSDHKIKKRKQ